SDMVMTEMAANPVLEESAPGDGPDDSTSVADDIAAIDATTADYTTPGEARESPPPTDFADASQPPAGSAEAAAIDGEAEPERERDSFQEIDFGSTFEEYLDPGYKTHEYEARDEVSFENMLTRRQSLYEQLIWQLHLTDIADDVRSAGEAIIGNL